MKKHLKDVYEGMKPRCDQCETLNKKVLDSKYRCCDAVFCETVEKGFKALGVHYEKTGHPELPFMGENGCVVAPEHRPGCTMFFCPAALEDRKSRRFYERKKRKLQNDPEYDYYTNSVQLSENDLMKAIERLKK